MLARLRLVEAEKAAYYGRRRRDRRDERSGARAPPPEEQHNDRGAGDHGRPGIALEDGLRHPSRVVVGITGAEVERLLKRPEAKRSGRQANNRRDHNPRPALGRSSPYGRRHFVADLASNASHVRSIDITRASLGSFSRSLLTLSANRSAD
jgi:hypothetical protein